MVLNGNSYYHDDVGAINKFLVTTEAITTTLSTDELCKNDPHWYVFLCSSLITFFTGLLFVLSWRILSWLFCQRNTYQPPPQPQPSAPTGNGSGQPGNNVGAWQKSPPADGGTAGSAEKNPLSSSGNEPEVGWMTEAKDWAGELISGQTTTGRILVCQSVIITRYDFKYCIDL
jgi:potassium large conductance calcium-activated channel subfamily M alpha member 1